jgi:hypothetical protein
VRAHTPSTHSWPHTCPPPCSLLQLTPLPTPYSLRGQVRLEPSWLLCAAAPPAAAYNWTAGGTGCWRNSSTGMLVRGGVGADSGCSTVLGRVGRVWRMDMRRRKPGKHPQQCRHDRAARLVVHNTHGGNACLLRSALSPPPPHTHNTQTHICLLRPMCRSCLCCSRGVLV